MIPVHQSDEWRLNPDSHFASVLLAVGSVQLWLTTADFTTGFSGCILATSGTFTQEVLHVLSIG